MLHLFLHVAVPAPVGWLFYPSRCSINFHPLHTYWAIGAYVVLLIPACTCVWATGFLVHMVLDYLKCLPLGVYRP